MKNTFGKTIAAQRLEKLVSESPSARRRISTLLSEYTYQMWKIFTIKDPRTMRLCLELLRDYTLRRLDIKTTLNESIRSYAKNIVIFRYRMFRQAFDIRIAERDLKKEMLDIFQKRSIIQP